MRKRVEAGCTPIESAEGLEIVCASAEVRALYVRRGFEPVWVGSGEVLPLGEALVRSWMRPRSTACAPTTIICRRCASALAPQTLADPLQARSVLRTASELEALAALRLRRPLFEVAAR